MTTSTLWTVEETHALRVAFENDPFISTDELRDLLPNRTLRAIWAKRRAMCLKRPKGFKRDRPGWKAIAKMLESGPMTRKAIQDALGCTDANVRGILDGMKDSWRVVGWVPGSYSARVALIGLGGGPHVPYSVGIAETHQERARRYRQNHRAREAEKEAAIARRDPLTIALFGARDVSTDALATLPSHVYRQSMSIDEEELAA